MTPELRVIQNEHTAGDLALIVHHTALLNDLTIRCENFTTMTQLYQFEAALADAVSATVTVNIAAAQAELAAAMRPAVAQEIKRQLQVLVGSFPNSSKQDLSIFGVALLEDVVADRPAIAALP